MCFYYLLWKIFLVERVRAVEFVKEATSGRTGPAILVCEDEDDERIELFCKLSAGCDEGVRNLARELLSAYLAADLELPVPRPYLVELDPVFLDVLPEGRFRNVAGRSEYLAFGSLRVPNQFSIWTPTTSLTAELVETAAGILLFDGIIQNPDRRSENPNCLVRGGDVRIIDHELAFTHGLVLGWRPPWEPGGMRSFETPGFHIFREPLRGLPINYEPISERWQNISDARLEEYLDALPGEWNDARATIQAGIDLIKEARDRIDGCIDEMRRILQ
ncbi:HipA family kinase [Oricola nitratireducens]|uniref:HipA family kinase n=1 Tax=Oricola nitratireducens TaxID=2775868 RepID=UPI0018670E5B|nr:HipA family kinase [Oricola nitratireducens]